MSARRLLLRPWTCAHGIYAAPIWLGPRCASCCLCAGCCCDPGPVRVLRAPHAPLPAAPHGPVQPAAAAGCVHTRLHTTAYIVCLPPTLPPMDRYNRLLRQGESVCVCVCVCDCTMPYWLMCVCAQCVFCSTPVHRTRHSLCTCACSGAGAAARPRPLGHDPPAAQQLPACARAH